MALGFEHVLFAVILHSLPCMLLVAVLAASRAQIVRMFALN